MPELEQRYPDGQWDDEAQPMALKRILLHNDDYVEFLVTRVWKLDLPCRVVDFGCGSGRFGMTLMPLLPAGSTYTGIDKTPALLTEARRVFDGSPYSPEFLEGDVHEVPFADDSFDLAISQAVLMHIPDPLRVIREMVRVTRHGGMVITCDANRNAVNAIVHTEELNTQETTPLAMIQSTNREIRRRTGVDHNIGVKTPFLMHKAGLVNVGARVSDCVRLIQPPIETEQQEALFRAMCEDGLGPDPATVDRAAWRAFLVKYGVPEAEAEAEISRALAQEFRAKGRDYHTAYPSLMSFSFGTVDKRA